MIKINIESNEWINLFWEDYIIIKKDVIYIWNFLKYHWILNIINEKWFVFLNSKFKL